MHSQTNFKGIVISVLISVMIYVVANLVLEEIKKRKTPCNCEEV